MLWIFLKRESDSGQPYSELFRNPAFPVILVLMATEFFRNLKRITGVDHHGELISELILIRIGEGLGMRTMVNSLGMISYRPGVDVIAREEIPLVVEEDFIVVDVAVEKRNF